MGVPVLVAHDRGCHYARPEGGGHSDAAKRVADTYNLHLAAGGAFIPNPAVGRIAVFALADGRSDGALYDTYRDAVRHQHHNEIWRAYARISPHSMTVCEAETFLRSHRLFFEAGFALPDLDDPDGGRVLIPALTAEDHRDQLAALSAGTWITRR